jgi:adenylyltransferase/sulfurtransferase
MRSSVVVAGCGGLGCVQATLLARAGVGRVRIIDRDLVEESNLQRQILFDEADARALRPKAMAAAERLRQSNSLVVVEPLVEDLSATTANRLLGGVDLILDATDNFDTRYLINDYSIATGTPWVYGACVGSQGMSFPILPRETACLRCVFTHAPQPGSAPSCDTAGVLGSIVGLVASLQVAEALKILAGRHEAVQRHLTLLDVWSGEYELIQLPQRMTDCLCCGQGRYEYLQGGMGSTTTSLCGRNAVQVRAPAGTQLDLGLLARRLEPLGTVQQTRFLLRAAIDGRELTVFADGRAIVGGTDDPAIAKSLYAHYIGT